MLARLQICHLIPLFWPLGSSACRLYANLPNLPGRPLHLHPGSATDKIPFRTCLFDSLTFPLWTGKYDFISSYCSCLSSIIAHYIGFLFLVLTVPSVNSCFYFLLRCYYLFNFYFDTRLCFSTSSNCCCNLTSMYPSYSRNSAIISMTVSSIKSWL